MTNLIEDKKNTNTFLHTRRDKNNCKVIMNRDFEGEYQHFLTIFHARHGFMQPPNFQQWLSSMNIGPQVVSNSRTDFCTEPVEQQQIQMRADWSELETEVLVTSWRENFLKLKSLDKEEGFTNITQSVNVVGKKAFSSVKTS